MVILDTNIIIDHLRTAGVITVFTKLLEHVSPSDVRLSLITVQELYAGKSTRELQKEKDVLATISSFEIFPYTYEIAKRAGELIRDSSVPLEFADAAIAATAITHGASLYTLNTKHFVGIQGVAFYNPS